MLGQERGDFVAFGDVQGCQRDLRPRLLQFRAQFGDAGGRFAAAAHQEQVAGAARHRPAGHVCAKSAGSAGDQHRTARLPAVGRELRQWRGPGQSAAEDAVSPDGELILIRPEAGERDGETCAHAVVHLRGQIDQPAPGVRVFQGRDAAQSPYGAV